MLTAILLSLAAMATPDETDWRAMNSLHSTENVYLLLRGGENPQYDIGNCKGDKCVTITDCKKRVNPIGWQPLSGDQ